MKNALVSPAPKGIFLGYILSIASKKNLSKRKTPRDSRGACCHDAMGCSSMWVKRVVITSPFWRKHSLRRAITLWVEPVMARRGQESLFPEEDPGPPAPEGIVPWSVFSIASRKNLSKRKTLFHWAPKGRGVIAGWTAFAGDLRGAKQPASGLCKIIRAYRGAHDTNLVGNSLFFQEFSDQARARRRLLVVSIPVE